MRLWRALMSKDLHSYEKPFSNDPCSPSMLRIFGTTRLLRSWDLSPYQNTRNSLAQFRVLNPIWPCCVLDWGRHWEMMAGWRWTTRARCSSKHRRHHLKGITSKRENRIIEAIPRLLVLDSSSNPNKGEGWKRSCSEYIHSCMIVNKDKEECKERWFSDKSPDIAVHLQNENKKG